MDIALSAKHVPIRLTAERWLHIVENHDDLAGHYDDVLETIEGPDFLIRGYRDSLIAVRGYGRRRYLMVVYRELSADDGLVITAYFANEVDRKKAIWKRP